MLDAGKSVYGAPSRGRKSLYRSHAVWESDDPRWLHTVFCTVSEKYFFAHRFETEIHQNYSSRSLKQKRVLVSRNFRDITSRRKFSSGVLGTRRRPAVASSLNPAFSAEPIGLCQKRCLGVQARCGDGMLLHGQQTAYEIIPNVTFQ